jgi:hypothetical protein
MNMPSTQAGPKSAAPAQRMIVLKHPYPLLTVLSWEFRRLQASRLNWVIAVATFGFFLLVLWLGRVVTTYPITSTTATGHVGVVAETSLVGLVIALPQYPGLFLSMFPPFLNTDGVTRDLKRRTHELLMTTQLPTWAYIWGRYLAGVLLSLLVAVLLLVAVVVIAIVLHLTQADAYPQFDLPGVCAVWAVLLVPPVLLLSSLSFALGTWLPQHANLIKVSILLGWFAGEAVLPQWAFQHGMPLWYQTWDPTSVARTPGLLGHFLQRIAPIAQSPTLSVQAIMLQVRLAEQQPPDLGPLVGPHLVWAMIGLLGVVIAGRAFRRAGAS